MYILQVLPYWDWTYLYEKDCLLRNPYIAPLPNITKEECLACFDVKKNGIEGLSNASLDVIANDFLLSDFPVIIEDSLKDWPDPDITLPKLADVSIKNLYLNQLNSKYYISEEPVYSKCLGCSSLDPRSVDSSHSLDLFRKSLWRAFANSV